MMALRSGRSGRRTLPPAQRALGMLGGLCGLLVLAGCSSFSSLTGAPPPPPCPPVSVLKDADTVTRLVSGGGQDLVDVVNTGEITGYDLTCDYNLDKKTKAGKVVVTLGLHITATRGPADRKREAPFGYFVAITDLDRNVLAWRDFGVVIQFPGNINTIPWSDDAPVSMTIPLPAGKTGQDFVIFTGFALSHEEVDYNRRSAGTRR